MAAMYPMYCKISLGYRSSPPASLMEIVEKAKRSGIPIVNKFFRGG